MYSGVTFLPMPSSISLSLLIVAHATVVSMFPVIVADAPDLNASSPSFVSSALPDTEWKSCIEHAVKIGLGTNEYDLETI